MNTKSKLWAPSNVKKIFLFMRGGIDEHTCFAELWDEKEARDYLADYLRTYSLDDKVFTSIRVERTFGGEDDARVYCWGYSKPDIQITDLMDHRGTRIFLGDEIVFNDLVPADPEHHDEMCTDCPESK